MDGYLVILDPMPLFGGEVPFYDGQPREPNGRFSSGLMPSSVIDKEKASRHKSGG